MRTTGNPNLAGAYDQEFAASKLVSVLLQHGIELFDLGLQRSAWEPKEDDAGMGEALVEDQLAEIAIGNDKDALLSASNSKNILIGKAMRVIAGDGRDVVAELLEVGYQPKIGALVEQKLHKGAASETAPFGGFGETSSPTTIAFA